MLKIQLFFVTLHAKLWKHYFISKIIIKNTNNYVKQKTTTRTR